MSNYLFPFCSAVLGIASWQLIIAGVFMILYWGETLGGYIALFIGCGSFAIVIFNSFIDPILSYPEDEYE